MRKLAIGLALASTVLATPALARDNSFYAGIEGGLMIVEDAKVRFEDTNQEIGELNFNVGFDVDVIAGYDFGVFRVEGELGYKHANLDHVQLPLDPAVPLDVDGSGRALSVMVNALLDLGGRYR